MLCNPYTFVGRITDARGTAFDDQRTATISAYATADAAGWKISDTTAFKIETLPLDDSLLPGLTLGRFGQWFGRHETWAAEAADWTGYLARSCALLSQGRFVADLALFYGETNNPTARFRQEPAAVPEGYAFDFVNKSVLSDVLQPMDGMLATATGMRYRALLVDTAVRYCSLPVLRQLALFADAGVLIAARPPEGCLNVHEERAAFDSLVTAIWHAGRSNVVPPESLAAALEQRGCPKDLLPL